MTGRTLIC